MRPLSISQKLSVFPKLGTWTDLVREILASSPRIRTQHRCWGEVGQSKKSFLLSVVIVVGILSISEAVEDLAWSLWRILRLVIFHRALACANCHLGLFVKCWSWSIQEVCHWIFHNLGLLEMAKQPIISSQDRFLEMVQESDTSYTHSTNVKQKRTRLGGCHV